MTITKIDKLQRVYRRFAPMSRYIYSRLIELIVVFDGSKKKN